MGKTKARPEGDVSVGLDRLDSLAEVEHVSLKQLTLRVCMLLALVTGHRGYAFHFLKVKDIKLKESKFTILYSEKHRQSWPAFHVQPAETLVSEQNSKLCSVKYCVSFLESRRYKIKRIDMHYVSKCSLYTFLWQSRPNYHIHAISLMY